MRISVTKQQASKLRMLVRHQIAVCKYSGFEVDVWENLLQKLEALE